MAEQLIDALGAYSGKEFDASGEVTKINSLKLFLIQTGTVPKSIKEMYNEISKNPLTVKSTIITDDNKDLFYKSSDQILAPSRRTIVMYTDDDAAKNLHIKGTESIYFLHVFPGPPIDIRGFKSSKFNDLSVYVTSKAKSEFKFKEKPVAKAKKSEVQSKKSEVKIDVTKPVDAPVQPVEGPVTEGVVERFDASDVKSIEVSKSGVAVRTGVRVPITSEVLNMSQEKWLGAVKAKVTSLLTAFIEDPNLRELFVSDQAMSYWARVFTHLSYNYIVNYEELEKLGDAMLKACFIDYLLRDDPTLKADEVNNVVARYVSKTYQAEVSDIMYLAKYLRHDVNVINVDIREDLMEAFIGALFRVANMIQDGLGYITVFNFVYLLYSNVDKFDSSLNSKTAVDQLFIAANWGRYEEQDRPAQPDVNTTANSDYSLFETTISLTPEAQRVLKAEGMWSSNDKVLGKAGAVSEKMSVRLAYDKAYDKLIEIGADDKYVANKKIHKLFKKAGLSKFEIQKAENKIKAMGFDYIEVQQKKEDNWLVDMKLVGMKITPKTRHNRASVGRIIGHINVQPGEGDMAAIRKLITESNLLQ